jgi:hypothetical protein
MNLDLSGINDWLATQGPIVQVVGGILLTLGVIWLNKKFGKPAVPVIPTPEPTPANVSPRLDAKYPLLNLLLNTLNIVPRGKVATVADLPHDVHMQLQTELDGVATQKAAAVERQRTDYTTISGIDPPAPTVPK